MDQQGLREQLEKHHRESFGWALCCCGRDRLRAEETLQRTYLKVLEGKARFADQGAFKTWLFAVIRTTARDERRREVLRRIGLLRHHARRSAATSENECGASDGEALDRERLREIFVAALSKLPGRQRQTLQLVFYHDMSLSEAAKVMGISLGSARTHYERGKQALRLSLGNKGIQ
jgi:RNA polymerase sigma-70 factor (ECF subfamily)